MVTCAVVYGAVSAPAGIRWTQVWSNCPQPLTATPGIPDQPIGHGSSGRSYPIRQSPAMVPVMVPPAWTTWGERLKVPSRVCTRQSAN